MIKVPITQSMLKNAIEKAVAMGKLPNSIRNGEGNVVGFLGEELVLAHFIASSENTYQHDISMGGYLWEVKSKDRTCVPRLDYDASVANFNTKQRADFYVFTSIVRWVVLDLCGDMSHVSAVVKNSCKEIISVQMIADQIHRFVISVSVEQEPYLLRNLTAANIKKVGQSEEFPEGYIMGFISPRAYKEQSRFLRKGDIDGTNKYRVKADCHNLRYDRLYPFD